MQFPLRDFFWLTVVIGLAVGIAIERGRVHEMSVHEGRAEWWQKAAHEVAERLQKETGESIRFDELKQLQVSVPARKKTVKVDGYGGTEYTSEVLFPAYTTTPYIFTRNTQLPNLSLLTGMLDLDCLMVILIIGAPLAVWSYRKGWFKQSIANPDSPIWKQPAFVVFWILFSTTFAIFHYWRDAPFSGAFFLFQAVVWAYFACQKYFGPKQVEAASA